MKLGNRLSVQAKRTIYSSKTDYLFGANAWCVSPEQTMRFRSMHSKEDYHQRNI